MKAFLYPSLSLFLLCQIFLNNAVSAEALKPVDTRHAVPQEVRDSQIKQRLGKIFSASGWFPNMQVEVKEGLVILTGQVESAKSKEWALEIVNKTEGVVAVIDKIDDLVNAQSVLKPAQDELAHMYEQTYKLLPYLASALILLIFFLFLAASARKGATAYLTRHKYNLLMTKSLANVAGIVFILLGLYFALKASGLSALAVTLLGGTGMLGLGLGLALKSTFENYTSSIMISLRELLRMGELVNINGFEGVVQSVTTRGTTLMDYEGNNIIIPNTDVFNSPIKNLTRNPKMRAKFLVGIGYEDDIDSAREIILDTLKELNSAVLQDPEPIVAVDNLGAATVNLMVYFWFDAIETSLIKVKSLVIQKVKENLVKGHISLPDDAREVVFASPLQIQNLTAVSTPSVSQKKAEADGAVVNQQRKVSTSGQALIQNLDNEVKDLQKQARQTQPAESGTNLL